jgi:putative transposase
MPSAEGNTFRAYQIRVKRGHPLYEYFTVMSHNAKNLYNVGNYYIRQVYTALTQDKPLEANQREVINRAVKPFPLGVGI